jgi:outer membrane lipoprotein-sorting protein
MESASNFNVVAIMIVREGMREDRERQVKVTIGNNGHTRKTILKPLNLQGLETVDDGRMTTTYIPDRRVMMTQVSPRSRPCDARFRLKLTERNYRLRLDRVKPVAGRESVAVVAVPKSSGLETRRFTFDSATGFLLRLETMVANEVPIVRLEAQAVDFPQSLPRDAFSLQVLGGVKQVNYRAPEKIAADHPALHSSGMKMVLPKTLPYGFAIQEIEFIEEKGRKMVAVRMTDGLVKATLYQHGRSSKERRGFPDAASQDYADRRFVLVGDLPNPARVRLLNTFIDELKRVGADDLRDVERLWSPGQTSLEPTTGVAMLSPLGRCSQPISERHTRLS